ncbi:MAG: tyrosine-type recombinase/integrase [Bdellovibrionales bacterium]
MSSSNYQLNKNKYLIDQEYDYLMKILSQYELTDPRNCLILQLALFTGARAKEILNIKIKDLNLYDESILIHGIKNSNDREIPIPTKTFKNLLRHLGINKNTNLAEKMDQLVFPISYNRFRQIWQHYRPVHKKLHSLRHTFAIRLYKKTKDIRLVQFALGHRNIANTMIYADYIYSQEELKKLLL